MSRAGRLFLLMDALRGNRRPVTAACLARQLGVSERTIYRDIQTLSELGAPVEGEAGIGYLLRTGFFLPPLMFGADEIEALVLGARWVRRQGDAGLAQAASNALAKIAAASPKDLRDNMAETSLWVPLCMSGEDSHDVFVQPTREAIRYQHKLRIAYRDEKGDSSERIVWPFALAFFDGKRLLAAWCEMRAAIRHFRVDRIAAAASTGERYPTRRHDLLKVWRAENGIHEDS
ncbi:helix-turn-helix transcriptional regulator [Janthinobacterium agaricidamnosum]|uniref:HTH domain protein n=1 Tax=Janthinobacterium agaricidamnosum NBRC 102515 = DSM 9628 TaxID=1349767 RepID=W0V035_9BURK|nr:YafY family protein [Janthinobacterium agaricidamnosum]CDG80960.1 HTH domain protein [Janthinobacterium agaricidamnosum NBRC 102515 = DSM 9628]